MISPKILFGKKHSKWGIFTVGCHGHNKCCVASVSLVTGVNLRVRLSGHEAYFLLTL